MNNYYIIEKNSASIENIKKVYSASSQFNFLGSSTSYDEAMNAILKSMPQILFLNLDDTIEKPFDFVQEINRYSNESPFIIALSATNEHAYKVIKMNFTDYLLKPLTELDLRKSMLSLTKQLNNESVSTVCLRSYKDYRYLNTEEILFLKADNNSTDFHMKDGNIISAYKTLKTFEELLPNNFLRIIKPVVIFKYPSFFMNFG